jgi:RNA polymerase sigma-70 factor, ECF subfamily
MGYQQARIVPRSELAVRDYSPSECRPAAGGEAQLRRGETTRSTASPDLPPAPDAPSPAEPEVAGAPDLSSVSTELLMAAMQGDPSANARLFFTLRPVIHRFCRARLAHGRIVTEPDDVAQEALLAIFMALPRYEIRHGISFRAFALAITTHKVADAQRAAARNRTDLVAQPLDRPGLEENAPEQHALGAEEAAGLHRLLQTLTPQQRAVLSLRVVVGLSAHDTARALGVSAAAVRVAQHRALRALRSQLTDNAGQRLPLPWD